MGGLESHGIMRFVCVFCFFAGWHFALAASTTSALPTEEEISKAIEQLGDEHLKVREEATDFLKSAGDAAEPALRKAGKSTDPEVAWRAGKILEDLELGLLPDTPPDIRQSVKEYQKADPDAKQAIFEELAGKGGNAMGAMIGIVLSEKDPNIRNQLLDQVEPVLARPISDLMLKGNPSRGRKLFDLALEREKDLGFANDGPFCVLITELTPQLEKLGRKKEADEIFTEVFDLYEKVCAKDPQNASHHNNLAWVGVVCRRRMDAALQHAIKAVELEPQNPAFLDTLAEIKFQNGDKEGSLELMKKCVQISPQTEYFKSQLKRIEAGDPRAKRPDEGELQEEAPLPPLGPQPAP